MLTSSKVKPNPVGGGDNQMEELAVLQTILIFNIRPSQQLKGRRKKNTVAALPPLSDSHQPPQAHQPLIRHNSMWVGRSCPSSPVPRQMLPCCECHPARDHVTQKMILCAQSTAGTAQMGRGGDVEWWGGCWDGMTVCVCRSACGNFWQNIKYLLHFGCKDGLDLMFSMVWCWGILINMGSSH